MMKNDNDNDSSSNINNINNDDDNDTVYNFSSIITSLVCVVHCTVETLYYEILGTEKFCLLYQ